MCPYYRSKLTFAALYDRDIHVVSLVHAVAIIILTSLAIRQPDLAADKVFGWHNTSEIANAVAVGYVQIFSVAYTEVCRIFMAYMTDTSCGIR